jgi:hypothetical protein
MIISIILYIVSLVILYMVIESAVKNGIRKKVNPNFFYV